jgi:hypothetical protein
MFQMQRFKVSLGDTALDSPVRTFNILDASPLIRRYIKWVDSVTSYNHESWLNGELLDLYLKGKLFGPLLRCHIF